MSVNEHPSHVDMFKGGRGENEKFNSQAMVIFQARDDGGLDQTGNNRGYEIILAIVLR